MSHLLGRVERLPTRSITFWVESEAMLGPATALAGAIARRYPRIDVVFVQSEPLDRGHGFPAYLVPLNLAVASLFTRLRTHTVIFCGLEAKRLEQISDIAARRGSHQVLLRESGIATEGDQIDVLLDPNGSSPEQAAESLERYIGGSRRHRLERLGRRKMRVRILRAGRHGALRALLSLKFPEYERIEDLLVALGVPGSILCLGNGPSSRHPGVEAMRCDRLFRVNHSWKDRGGPFLSPDLVFTGQRDTVMALRPPYGFVFGKIQSEEKILSGLLYSWRRLSYGTAQRLGLHTTGCGGKAAPTNGALMVATAVALRPRRLVIAGIDLFSDPAGAYPGDPVTENAYAVGHDASFERDFILGALRRHEGELVVFGRGLRSALRAERSLVQGED